MEQVTRYLANDGTLFETEVEAAQHELELALETALEQHFESATVVGILVDSVVAKPAELATILRNYRNQLERIARL